MNPGSGTDNETLLIENIKDGERASFDSLMSLYQQKGISIAYHMIGNLEDAKDVLQEAFVKVYLNIGGFRGYAKFSTWFYRIVVNCSLDFLRRRKRSDKFFIVPFADEEGKGKEQEVEDLRNEPARVVIANELSKKLDECIEALSEKQKACFILKYRNGLSSHEISGIMKCSQATVKVHLFRAVKTLQEKLAGYLIR